MSEPQHTARSIHLDARRLSPPEPFIRTLELLSGLKSGERLHVLLSREPYPLYQFLQENGILWESSALPNGEFEIIIQS